MIDDKRLENELDSISVRLDLEMEALRTGGDENSTPVEEVLKQGKTHIVQALNAVRNGIFTLNTISEQLIACGGEISKAIFYAKELDVSDSSNVPSEKYIIMLEKVIEKTKILRNQL